MGADKMRDDDGIMSDPRERLHLLRFEYKNNPHLTEPDAVGRATVSSGVKLSDEARKNIEENRKRALEKRKQRKEQDGTAGAATSISEDPDAAAARLLHMEQEAANAARVQQSQQPWDFDEEDVFGFEGFDSQPVRAKPQAPAPAPFDDEEDVFGFGGGFDEGDHGMHVPPPVPAAKVTSEGDSALARRIAENKAKALAKKKLKEQEAVAAAAASNAQTTLEKSVVDGANCSVAPDAIHLDPNSTKQQAEPSLSASAMEDPFAGGDEEDVFGFGGGFDDVISRNYAKFTVALPYR